MAKYWALRIAAIVVPLIPVWIARPGAWALGLIMWALAPGARRRAERNLRHVPGLAMDPVRLHRAVQGVFCHTALNYLDFFRGPHLTNDDLLPSWHIENADVYLTAMAQGRGLIMVTGHFGNWELGVSRLGALGYRMVAPAERMRPAALFDLFCRLRDHHGLRLVPADSRDSLREMLDTLKRGELVMFLADRYVLGASAEVAVFGEPAKLPTGPFALALKNNVPLMAVFSWRNSVNSFGGRFVPLDVSGTTDEAEPPGAAPTGTGMATGTSTGAKTATRTRAADATLRTMRVFITELEKMIEEHPEQWVAALSPIWDAT
ncbi:MAG TPA: lysophospholipid acyltransferase family protein [Ktedonobacterales bacterium]|nr:lysophospholipid acyltransferase family protein [Ktedonobacterales bacterium]